MKGLRASISTIVRHINEIPDTVDLDVLEDVIRYILGAERIFIVGAGRSGLVGKAFAMRLMHLGKKVYVIGETITPAVSEDDLVIAITGSGNTNNVVTSAKISKQIGARVIAFTANKKGELLKYVDVAVFLKAKTKELSEETDYIARQLSGGDSHTALGTLFEISAMVLLDGLITELMNRLGKTEKDLKKRHSNLE